MFDPTDERDDFEESQESHEDERAGLLDAVAFIDEAHKKQSGRVELAKQPIFQALFTQSIDPDDVVLRDFAEHVVGPLSDLFGAVAAKGGAFFQQKEAEGAKNTYRYQRDQTLRGHLINGMLPALHIARYLAKWEARSLRYWDELTERLFIAGFMLHDYTKIPAVKKELELKGFKEMEAPSAHRIPDLEEIFAEWCDDDHLNLDAFLRPVGGAAPLIQDLIYVVHNTQIFSGTAHAPVLLPNKSTSSDVYMLAEKVSRLADLLAYIAPTPRAMVADETIQNALIELTLAPAFPGSVMARLTYHHIAENRGLLLNFIHDAALNVLAIHDQRVPLLYAPSGVVYLERYDAPPMPIPANLIERVVSYVRAKAGEQLINTGKGAKRGNVGLQVDDSYNDFFDLRELVSHSPQLVGRFIKNNKSVDRLAPISENGWPGGSNIPSLLADPKDARLDQIAEWAGLMEIQFRDRMDGFDVSGWLLNALEIDDLANEFQTLRDYPEAKKGGIKYWWFWAAAHALARKPGIQPQQILEWLAALANDLAIALPHELPASASVNEDTWNDLTDYVGRVLTVGGAKKPSSGQQTSELARYVRAKGGRAKAICAMCGSDYITRKPTETAVSFQPGVYTARIRLGPGENKRSLCSICALEQLLRQLFMINLDTGGKVEEQKVRYLSFYPSYFFTPETLKMVKRVYDRLHDMRLSNQELLAALKENDLTNPSFWQHLEKFLIPQVAPKEAKQVMRYNRPSDPQAQATFLMVGFRNFNKPSDTESWVLPAFLALVLPICLDVKVVASEGSVPLLMEAHELPETVWFDGVHPAIQALLSIPYVIDDIRGQPRLHKPGSRLNVDDVSHVLPRLVAAYIIHLETEYSPPKENWQRFTPIAHSLAESPLYVFHYLKKQERDGLPIGADQVHRYVTYAESIFDTKGDRFMADARRLVELYRKFYRAKRPKNANSVLRPLSVVADAILALSEKPQLIKDDDELYVTARSALFKFMERVHKGQADGYLPKGSQAPDREQAMDEFCQMFVRDIFITRFGRNAGTLRGKEMNLLRDGCDYLYREAQWQENAVRGPDPEIVEDDETSDSSV